MWQDTSTESISAMGQGKRIRGKFADESKRNAGGGRVAPHT